MWLMIVAVCIMMGNTISQYTYHRPNNTPKLPRIESNIQQVLGQNRIQDFLPQQTIENVVSYSAPFPNYYDLNQQNDNLFSGEKYASNIIGDITAALHAETNHQNNLAINSLPHNNIPTINIPALELTAPIIQQSQRINNPINENSLLTDITYSHVNLPTDSTSSVNIASPIKQLNSLEGNTVQHLDTSADNIPNIKLFAPIKQQSSFNFNTVQHTDIPDLNIPNENALDSDQLQSNFRFRVPQYIQQDDNLNAQINIQNNVAPEITKHIYFHVPPPEIEESSVRTVIPKIKKYKIIFIKVPSQENKDIAQLQKKLYNQIAPVEEKTIIYVLSKKPTVQQVVLPQPIPSQHEVLFVKYTGSLGNAISQINDNPEPELLPTLRSQDSTPTREDTNLQVPNTTHKGRPQTRNLQPMAATLITICSVLQIQSLPINNGFSIKLNPVLVKDEAPKTLGTLFAKIPQDLPPKVASQVFSEDIFPRSVELATGCTNQIAKILFPIQGSYSGSNDTTTNNRVNFINVPVMMKGASDYKILVVSAPHNVKLGKDDATPMLVYIVFPSEDNSDTLKLPSIYFVNKSDGKLDLKSRAKVDPILIIDNNRTVTGLKSKEVSKFVKFNNKFTNRRSVEANRLRV